MSNLSGKILSIAQTEWPNLDWHIVTDKNVKSGAVQGYDEGISKLFDPLSDFNDLMPLVVKYRLDMEFIPADEKYHEYINAFKSFPDYVNTHGKHMKITADEYCKVGVRALYALICGDSKQ